jgi:aryl-alcohol dehydrogenase-like predicted oxidoreductase
MHTRTLGPFTVSAIGMGCMSLSHAYGTPPDPSVGAAVLRRGLELGYTMLDTAALYGFGANETLIGETLGSRRHEFVLASKGGMFRDEQGRRAIDGRPEVILANCDESLQRLETDVIDLYYLHRWDKKVPIEESVGAMADLVRQGKVRTIGLSEVSAPTIRRAHAVHPLTAVQTEYSLWSRNAELAVLDTCRELGIAFVAFSPLARGFLAGSLRDTSLLPPKDIRLNMPRFQGENFTKNLALLDGVAAVARDAGASMAQVVLAWVLQRGSHIIPIPGTTKIAHLEENAVAADLHLSADVMARLDALVNPQTVSGRRYNDTVLAEIDTETLPHY